MRLLVSHQPEVEEYMRVGRLSHYFKQYSYIKMLSVQRIVVELMH